MELTIFKVLLTSKPLVSVYVESLILEIDGDKKGS